MARTRSNRGGHSPLAERLGFPDRLLSAMNSREKANKEAAAGGEGGATKSKGVEKGEGVDGEGGRGRGRGRGGVRGRGRGGVRGRGVRSRGGSRGGSQSEGRGRGRGRGDVRGRGRGGAAHDAEEARSDQREETADVQQRASSNTASDVNEGSKDQRDQDSAEPGRQSSPEDDDSAPADDATKAPASSSAPPTAQSQDNAPARDSETGPFGSRGAEGGQAAGTQDPRSACERLGDSLRTLRPEATSAPAIHPECQLRVEHDLRDATIWAAIASVTEAISEQGQWLFALIDGVTFTRPAARPGATVLWPAHTASAGSSNTPGGHWSLFIVRRVSADGEERRYEVEYRDSHAPRRAPRSVNAAWTTARPYLSNSSQLTLPVPLNWNRPGWVTLPGSSEIAVPTGQFDQPQGWTCGIFTILNAWVEALGLTRSTPAHHQLEHCTTPAMQLIRLAMQGLLSAATIRDFLVCYRFVDPLSELQESRSFERTVALPSPQALIRRIDAVNRNNGAGSADRGASASRPSNSPETDSAFARRVQTEIWNEDSPPREHIRQSPTSNNRPRARAQQAAAAVARAENREGGQVGARQSTRSACDRLQASLAALNAQAATAPAIHDDCELNMRENLAMDTVYAAIGSVTEAVSDRGQVLFSLIALGGQEAARPTRTVLWAQHHERSARPGIASGGGHISLFIIRADREGRHEVVHRDSSPEMRNSEHLSGTWRVIREALLHADLLDWGRSPSDTSGRNPVRDLPASVTVPDGQFNQPQGWTCGLFTIINAWIEALDLERARPSLANLNNCVGDAVHLVRHAIRGLLSAATIRDFLECFGFIRAGQKIVNARSFRHTVPLPSPQALRERVRLILWADRVGDILQRRGDTAVLQQLASIQALDGRDRQGPVRTLMDFNDLTEFTDAALFASHALLRTDRDPTTNAPNDVAPAARPSNSPSRELALNLQRQEYERQTPEGNSNDDAGQTSGNNADSNTPVAFFRRFPFNNGPAPTAPSSTANPETAEERRRRVYARMRPPNDPFGEQPLYPPRPEIQRALDQGAASELRSLVAMYSDDPADRNYRERYGLPDRSDFFDQPRSPGPSAQDATTTYTAGDGARRNSAAGEESNAPEGGRSTLDGTQSSNANAGTAAGGTVMQSIENEPSIPGLDSTRPAAATSSAAPATTQTGDGPADTANRRSSSLPSLPDYESTPSPTAEEQEAIAQAIAQARAQRLREESEEFAVHTDRVRRTERGERGESEQVEENAERFSWPRVRRTRTETRSPAVDPRVRRTSPTIDPRVRRTSPAVDPRVRRTSPAVDPRLRRTSPAVDPRLRRTRTETSPAVDPRVRRTRTGTITAVDEDEKDEEDGGDENENSGDMEDGKKEEEDEDEEDESKYLLTGLESSTDGSFDDDDVNLFGKGGGVDETGADVDDNVVESIE